MPELPEVEVVRAGLAPAVTGARVLAVEVMDPRALKRHTPLGEQPGLGGHGRTLSAETGRSRASDFERRLTGQTLQAPLRRGKFMWIPLADPPGSAPVSPGAAASLAPGTAPTAGTALLAHLGMSGQLLLRATDAADDRHVRIRTWIEHPEHGELRLDFADQRLFGSLALDALTPTAPLGAIPQQAAHIARDPLDEHFDDGAFVAAIRSRGVGAKKLLLDQRLVSGVGNIYADETLWRARVHPEAPGSSLTQRRAASLLHHMREVFAQALAEGGTSFDEQYVNVNGQAGYFAHSLNAYGRGGEACPRCGGPIKRVPFGGRSSHFCPRCQRRPSAPNT
ncbi:bifunctional DNA-formamidopyrimidine glycosylase/DNA-(apurinic or apyrimidinic site) lyase [Leucobacter albus]|uniref:Formamidopyrimidine-DNA glycosylase n=1 Tax=Leucobacter albus TaxID=272210 RepID=A0ABW3TJA5_9MICO